jgi:hypothetical protein
MEHIATEDTRQAFTAAKNRLLFFDGEVTTVSESA